MKALGDLKVSEKTDTLDQARLDITYPVVMEQNLAQIKYDGIVDSVNSVPI